MAKLIYFPIASLDGYIEDEQGEFGWSAPDAEAHTFINDFMRPFGTHLYGRRMYEVMAYWEDYEASSSDPPHELEFASLWKAAEKVVYSRTLQTPSTSKTRIESEFDVDAVREIKATATSDIAIAGPELAGQAARAGLLDELHLLLVPIVVGGGKPFLPPGIRVRLELISQRRFTNGSVYLHYRFRP